MQSHRVDEGDTSQTEEIVELRVHGVGNTPPDVILDVPATRRVAGDDSAGFFRPWVDEGDVAVEAYSWGNLTSASSLRALWVLLFPFAIANLAGWMLRHGGQPTDTDRRSRSFLESAAMAAVRVFSVVLSIALAAYVSIGAIDLVGYQCGARLPCVADRWWLWPWGNRFVAGQPNRSVAVGVVVAAAVMLFVAWLARRSQIAIHDLRREDFDGTDDPAFEFNLNHRVVWRSPHVAHRLGLTHTAACLTVVGLTVATAANEVDVFPATAVLVGWVVLIACVVVVVRLAGIAAFVHATLLALSALYVGAVILGLLFADPLPPANGPLPRSGDVVVALLPVYAAGTLLVGGLAYVLWRSERNTPLRTALTGPVLLLAAAGTVNAFGSGLLIRLADLLGRGASASDNPGGIIRTQIVYADWVSDVAVVTVFALVVFLVAGGVAWLRAGSGLTCEQMCEIYPDLDCSDRDDRRWAARVARARAIATVTDQVGPVTMVSAVVVVAALAIAVIVSDDRSGLGIGSWADPLGAPASVVLGLIPVLAVVAISQLYRNRAVRRIVGVVWDVATFWPRWFHPWSPPAYGERAVPQLGARIDHLGGPVVLSAHSQGSVLALATITTAKPETRPKVALLTHGSPLRRLYAHFFPEYFSPELFAEVAKQTAGWINLWRCTDYIGGPIGAEGVEDHEVLDPESSRPPYPGEARPVPLRHSGYEKTEKYRAALGELLSRLRSE
ncbi:MAG TPA: hypothetical protein VF377_00660 [Acidimicrobiia bacterium]|jgi:hypothetical protein